MLQLCIEILKDEPLRRDAEVHVLVSLQHFVAALVQLLLDLALL